MDVDREKIEKVTNLIIETMAFNNINRGDGVTAMLSLVLTDFLHAGFGPNKVAEIFEDSHRQYVEAWEKVNPK